MKISTNELKKELSKRQEELKDCLTLRLHDIFYQIINEELSEDKEEEIPLFDLIVRIILRADEGPSENIANLMVPLKAEKCHDLDEWTLSSSAAFIRDYLKKDYIYHILETKSRM